MNRILVIRGGAIGDFILTLPAMKLLRDVFPRAHLEILGCKHIAALAERRFYAEAVHSIEDARLARFFVRGAELLPSSVNFFASFDLVVSYLFDPDGIFQRNLRRCGVENLLVGSPKIQGNDHVALQLARPLAQLGLGLTNPAARLYPSYADREWARCAYPEGMIAIHPGSGSASKNWPLENWIALLEELLARDTAVPLLIVGGEADGPQLATLRSAFHRGVRFAENLLLTQLAAVLERCAFFIGHDSGISHIAAAAGTRSLLLFGPSNPAVWAPGNTHAHVLRACRGKMSDIPTTDVLERFYELMRIGIRT